MNKTLKILVADDEKDILDVMVKKIRQERYEVISASDGQEAWDKIQKDDPDIVLLDLNMPNLHGFEVLKKIREQTDNQTWKPVIIVSAQDELDDIKQGYALEADHYITKPCSMVDVVKAIKLMESLIPQRIEDKKS